MSRNVSFLSSWSWVVLHVMMDSKHDTKNVLGLATIIDSQSARQKGDAIHLRLLNLIDQKCFEWPLQCAKTPV